MAKKSKSTFIKRKQPNQVVLGRQIDLLGKKIEKHKQIVDSVFASYDTHVEHLSNFARHDMKNSVQSMDSILSTVTLAELTEENWESLKQCLEDIRKTIDNFSQLTPYTQSKAFKVKELINAVELLTRSALSENKVSYKFDYQRADDTLIHQPFQALLLVLTNLVWNSIKALEGNQNPVFSLRAKIDGDICTIKIRDNGNSINEDILSTIFEYGFSTTGGSGIGLYHAKYVCARIQGKLKVENLEVGIYNKCFIVEFPIDTI